ncbi:MAG: FHA domain-containing protein [Polyangiaceae bacterium]
MPVTLRVLSDDTEVTRITSDSSRVVIGRSGSSDLRLPDPSVSQRHAVLERKGSDYVLIDEGSTNGTWVNGARLASHTPKIVKSGETVRFGRVWVALEMGGGAVPNDLKAATKDLALALVAHAMDAMGDDIVPVVRVMEGPDMGGELRLTIDNRAYVIGRGEHVDLPLADPDTSREHVHVVRRGFSVLVRDLGSKNGSRCGDQAVPQGKDLPWKPQALLQIGRTVLSVHEPVAAALADLSELPDERVQEAELVDAAPPPAEVLDAPPPEPVAAALADVGPAPTAAIEPERAPPKQPSGWTPADFAIIAVAVVTIALSALGFFWLMKS